VGCLFGRAGETRMGETDRDFFSVFVRGRTPAEVVRWLEEVLGPLTAPSPDGWPRVYEAGRGRVLVGHTPGDREVSVWFHRDGAWAGLWGDLAGCAERASRELDAEVLYFAGDWAMRVVRGRHEPAVL
jgi:hypothetical protein